MKYRCSAVTRLLFLSFVVAAVMCAGCKRPAPPPPEAITEPKEAEAERAKLRGSWKYSSLSLNGKSATPAVASEFVCRFDGSKYTLTRAGKTTSEGTYALDPTKSPPWLDFTDSAGAPVYGIDRLDGDNLTMCQNVQQRPTDFESKPGQVRSLIAAVRAKP